MADPTYFATPKEWRAWLEKNHDNSDGLMVGLAKTGSGLPYIGYAEVLDEALCFGWIDGRRHSIDDKRWMIRFSPRTRRSIWSAANLKHIDRLTKAGKMHAAGTAVFENRDRAREKSYSFENQDAAFAPEEEKAFRRNKAAWSWFEKMPRSYRHPATWWVVSAKKPETRARRLATLIADSAEGRKVGLLRRPGEA
jgi:uncharacterized protein YdeI (YjbR/CyaY-like superfamily)